MHSNFEILMSGLACVHSEYCGCEVFVIGKSSGLQGLCVSSSVGTMTDRFKDCARQAEVWLRDSKSLEDNCLVPLGRESVIYASRGVQMEILFVSLDRTVKNLQNLLGNRLKHKGDEIRFVADGQHLKGDVLLGSLAQRSLRYVFKRGPDWEV